MRANGSWGETAAGLALAAVLLGLAGASGPFFVSAVGSELLGDEVAALGEEPALLRTRTAGPASAAEIRAADEQLQDELDRRELPAADLQLVVGMQAAGDDAAEPQAVNLIGRPGASAHLPPTVEDADGSWAMMAPDAAAIGATAGGEIQLVPGAGEAIVTVGPLVEGFERRTLPTFWQPVSGLLLDPLDPRDPSPPPALLGDPDDVLAALEALEGDDPAGGPPVEASWTALIPDDLTLEQARELEPAVAALTSDVVRPTTELGARIDALGPRPLARGQLGTVLGRADAAAASLAVPVQLLAIGAQLLGLGAVAAATVLGGRRALARVRLWAARGVSPVALATRFTAGAVAPLVVGVGIGWAAAYVLTGPLGTGGAVDRRVLVEVWGPLSAIVALAAGVVAVTVAAAARRGERADRPPRRVPPIAEAVAVGAAILAYVQTRARGGGVEVGPDGVVGLDVLAVGAPLLLVIATAGVGARLVRVALRWLADRPMRGTVAYLAVRRLRSVGGAGLALVFVGAASAGVLLLADVLSGSVEATIEEKTRLSIGADVAASLPRAEASLASLELDTLTVPTTTVRRVDDALLDDRVAVEVLAIDPDRFAAIAHRPEGWASGRLEELATRLHRPRDDAPVPAIVVGTPAPATGTLVIDELEIELTSVGTTERFPGVDGQRPAVVVPDDGALAADDPGLDARLATRVQPELWADAHGQPDAQVRAQFAELDLRDDAVVFQTDEADDPGLAPTEATFTYLRGQGMVVAALGLLGLCAFHVVRRRQQALGSVLAERMGLTGPARRAADIAELGALLAITASGGAAAGIAAAHLVLPAYDPLPDVPLPVVHAIPTTVLWVVAASVATATLVTATVTARVVERTDVPALLRGDG